MLQTARRIVESDSTRRRKTDQDRKEIMLKSILMWLFVSMIGQQDPRRTFIQALKGLSLQMRQEARQASEFVRSLDREAIRKLGVKMVKSAPREIAAQPETDWFEAFWGRKSQDMGKYHEMSPDQLALAHNSLVEERENFWYFKC
jgi:hypothetical protein